MAKKKYIEGQVYEFSYVKKIVVDGEHLVFEDENGERFLLPSEHYKNYKLIPGQKVKCLVTRINCSGKIFFEPEHPFYKVGQVYEFDFIRMQIVTDTEYDPLTGKEKKVKYYELIVADIDGGEHWVIPHKWQKKRNFKAEKIRCRLKKIVKGHFLLVNLEEEKSFLNKIGLNNKRDKD